MTDYNLEKLWQDKKFVKLCAGFEDFYNNYNYNNVDFSNIGICNATIKNNTFTNCNFENANFTDTIIDSCEFVNCNMRLSVLPKECNNVIFKKCYFSDDAGAMIRFFEKIKKNYHDIFLIDCSPSFSQHEKVYNKKDILNIDKPR